MSANEQNITQKLVRKLRSGDQAAFKVLYLQFGKKLFQFSRKYKLSTEECNEIVQEVFLKTWEKRKTLDPDQSFNAFVITVARNLIFNKFKKKVYEKAYLSYLENADPSHYDTEKEVIYADIESIAQRAIEQLPEKRRHIFKLSRESGLSNQEIAESLNISKSTVENQMNKCLKFLKEYLKQNAEIIPNSNQ